MTEKEKQVQKALGTMKRQVFVMNDYMDGFVGSIQDALENFGLFIYADPTVNSTDVYGFVISNEKLTDEQIEKMCQENYENGEENK